VLDNFLIEQMKVNEQFLPIPTNLRCIFRAFPSPKTNLLKTHLFAKPLDLTGVD
jgi:hypothetical protein